MTLLQEGRRMRMTWLIGGWVVAWALVIAMPVMAGDGVLEINQTCATETGCFPGDAPGFPVTLNESGSFALTGNLFVDVEATAIEVGARPVDLDLNGFTIEGRGRAIQDLANGSSSGFVRVHGGSIKGRSGISLSEGTIENLMVTTDADGVLCDTCMITNSIIKVTGDGLTSTAFVCGQQCTSDRVRIFAPRRGVSCLSGRCTVRRSQIQVGPGTVSCATCYGISCPSTNECVVQDTLILDSPEKGIVAGQRAQILDSQVRNSQGGPGVQCGNGCLVRGTTVSGSSAEGINAGQDSLVQGNVVVGNGGDGIQVGVGSTVIGNTSNQNTVGGIRASRAATIRENTVRQNGLNGTGSGIIADVGSQISGNSSRSNGGFGLRAEGKLGYANNTFTDNNGGDANPQVQQVQAGAAIDLGGNICGTDTTCP
jgi:hypothetical protein